LDNHHRFQMVQMTLSLNYLNLLIRLIH
jgi:hypothetical protein